MRLASFRIAAIVAVVGLSGCGFCDVLTHLVGQSEPAPPLGRLLAPAPVGGGSGGLAAGDSEGGSLDWGEFIREPLNPAIGATMADLAGIWVHAGGFGAIHIDNTGRIFQADLPEEIDGEPIPSLVPRTLFNAGSASVSSNGIVTATVSVSLAGLTASATLRGLLDSTHNIIFDVNTVTTINLGDGPSRSTDFIPWYRWDPVTGTFPGLQ